MHRTIFILLGLLASVARADTPFQLDPWGDTTVLVITGTESALLYGFADDLISPRCPCDRNEVNAFDRGVIGNRSDAASTASDVTFALSVLTPIALEAWADGFSRDLAIDAVVLAETMLVNAAIVSAVKVTVQRPLPRTYEGDPSLVGSSGGYRSFYSGHTSGVFAALGYFSTSYYLRGGRGLWPWALEIVVGASVAAERVAAGRHFYTDVLVGAGAGALVGWAVPWLHRRTHTTLGFAPNELGGGTLSATWRW